MCNSYRVQPKRDAVGLAKRVSETVTRLTSDLVRKSDLGVVVRADGEVKIMRWGFHRSFNPAINNARSDKLEVGMWADAYRERRCVIPMTLFYEWGAGTGGRKQAHEFHDAEDNYLWIAGIWEENADHGSCYSMVTTASSPLMAPIHDRMPALLRPEEISEFLSASKSWDFQPFAGPMEVRTCESPLTKRRQTSDSQLDLF